MIQSLPYSPSLTVKELNRFFKKDYYKKPYDRFMWWRSYTPIKKPLTNRHSLRDRILNGDFEIAPYQFEAQIVEHRLNKRYEEIGNDPGRYMEETSVDKARRKRLLEDYEKEEARRLTELKLSFVKEFRMTKEHYDTEVLRTKKTVIDFYFHMEEKYGARIRRSTPVPVIS